MQYFMNQNDAITVAASAIQTMVGNFQGGFSPEAKSKDSVFDTISKVLGYFDMIVPFANFKIWSKVLSPRIFEGYSAGKDKIESARGSFGAIFDVSSALAQAQKPDLEGQVGIRTTIQEFLLVILDGMKANSENYLKHLFATDGSGMEDMLAMIDDGKWARVVFTGAYELVQEVSGAILSRPIPISWSIDARRHPVLIVGDWNTVLPTSVRTVTVDGKQGVYNKLFSTSAESINATVQYEGKTLWLMDAHDCDAANVHGCDARVMYPLPGLSELYPGNTKWGGLSYADMAISTYVANGNKNGPAAISYSDMVVTNQGYAAKGVYSFVVCDVDTIMRSWQKAFRPSLGKAERCETYPCC